jgi:predicted dithiol-disulfide oxidoreductase (DUF899 family)
MHLHGCRSPRTREREQVDTVFEGRSGYPDLTTEQASFTPEQVKSGAVFYNYTVTDLGDLDRVGISVFSKDESGAVFHTYSCYARGVDMMNATYQYLDLTPRGRDEDGPEDPLAWVRYHDRYED